MDEIIKLIAVKYTKDEYGIQKKTETEREVFGRIRSITRQEYFDAGRNGLNPELSFIVFFADYEGETILEYQGKRYLIYRTYRTPSDDMELYVERRGGTNG